MKTLKDFVEQISDDFRSTFSVVDDWTLQNVLGHTDDDFEELTKIIKKYIPNAEVHFSRVNRLTGARLGIHLISVTLDDSKQRKEKFDKEHSRCPYCDYQWVRNDNTNMHYYPGAGGGIYVERCQDNTLLKRITELLQNIERKL